MRIDIYRPPTIITLFQGKRMLMYFEDYFTYSYGSTGNYVRKKYKKTRWDKAVNKHYGSSK